MSTQWAKLLFSANTLLHTLLLQQWISQQVLVWGIIWGVNVCTTWLASQPFSSFGHTLLTHKTSTSSITFWLASLHSVISICNQNVDKSLVIDPRPKSETCPPTAILSSVGQNCLQEKFWQCECCYITLQTSWIKPFHRASRLLVLNQPASFEELLAVKEGKYRCGLGVKTNNRSNSALGYDQTFSLVTPMHLRFTGLNFKQSRLSQLFAACDLHEEKT